MEYITKKDITNRFAKYKIGDDVIVIRDIRINSENISPPLRGIVTNIGFVNKRAIKQIPKYRIEDIDKLQIDPDLLVYTVRLSETNIPCHLYEHAIIPCTENNEYLQKKDCEGLYRSKHRQFIRFIKERRHKRLIRSTIAALVSLILCIWLAVMTFRTNTMGENIMLSVLYIFATAGIFAMCNRYIERIHLK